MSDKLIQIIDKKINLFLRPNKADFGFELDKLHRPLTSYDLNNINSILEEYSTLKARTINNQFDEIIKIIKLTIIESGIDNTPDISDSIIGLIDKKFNPEKHIEGLSKFLEALKRKFAGMGAVFNPSNYRLDLIIPVHEVLIKTRIRENTNKLRAELDILCLKADQENPANKKSLKKFYKGAIFQPNFFGIGWDFNDTISRIKNWWAGRKWK